MSLLTKSNFKILYDIGDDAPNIFFGWYTSANSTIRTQAKGIAKTLTEKLEESLLKRAEVSRDAFFEAMFMLRIKNEMELTARLLAHWIGYGIVWVTRTRASCTASRGRSLAR